MSLPIGISELPASSAPSVGLRRQKQKTKTPKKNPQESHHHVILKSHGPNPVSSSFHFQNLTFVFCKHPGVLFELRRNRESTSTRSSLRQGIFPLCFQLFPPCASVLFLTFEMSIVHTEDILGLFLYFSLS